MCVIGAMKIDNKIYMFKNRDRMYNPRLLVYHTLYKDTEIAFLYDIDTGWIEGINSNRIAITNSSLMVGLDENEKKIRKTSGTKSLDGKRIIRHLTKDCIHSISYDMEKIKRMCVRGHTLICNGEEIISIEATKKSDFYKKKIDLDSGLIIRTNHGYNDPTLGYTIGENYKSSKIRKYIAEKLLKEVKNKDEILKVLRKQVYSKESQLNIFRSTEKMRTTSQLLYDFSNLTLNINIIKSSVKEFRGIYKSFPIGYEPKIKIIIDSI